MVTTIAKGWSISRWAICSSRSYLGAAVAVEWTPTDSAKRDSSSSRGASDIVNVLVVSGPYSPAVDACTTADAAFAIIALVFYQVFASDRSATWIFAASSTTDSTHLCIVDFATKFARDVKFIS